MKKLFAAFFLAAVSASLLTAVPAASASASAGAEAHRASTYTIGTTYRVKPNSGDGWRNAHPPFNSSKTCSTNDVGFSTSAYITQIGYGSAYIDRIQVRMKHPAQQWTMRAYNSAIRYNRLSDGKRVGYNFADFGGSNKFFDNGRDTETYVNLHIPVRLSPSKYNVQIIPYFLYGGCNVAATTQLNMAS